MEGQPGTTPPRPSTASGEGPVNGFPTAEFGALLKRLPRYARLAWTLGRDPRLSRTRRAALLAAAAYVASPIDVVPGIIPVLGQLDDMAVALSAIRFALGGLPPEARAASLAEAGLTQADLDADVRATGEIAGWLARSGWKVGRRVASVGLKGFGAAVRGVRSMSRRVRAAREGTVPRADSTI